MYNNTHRKSVKASTYRKGAISQNKARRQKVSCEVLNKDKIWRIQQRHFSQVWVSCAEAYAKSAPSLPQVCPKSAPSLGDKTGCTPCSAMDTEKKEEKRQKCI